MKQLFPFLLLFSFVSAKAGNFKDPQWLIRLTSTFTDDDGEQRLKVAGSGTVVSIENQCFILTASHVSEGEGLEAFSKNDIVKLDIRNKVVDVDRDIALIPILDCRIKPIAHWVSQPFELGLFKIPKEEVKKWGEKCRFFCDDPINLVQVAGTGELVPKGTWVKMETNDWIASEHRHNFDLLENQVRYRGRPFLSRDGYEVATHGMVVPGMSGAPLFMNAAKYGATISGNLIADFRVGVDSPHDVEDGYIGGVANRYLRYFNRSFYSSPYAIHDVVQRWLKKDFAQNKKSTWRLRNCLQYRVDSTGVSEISRISKPSGNGISGGPGSLCSEENAVGTDSMKESWRKWEISHGLGDSNGQSIIAFRLSKNTDPNSHFFVDANWAQKLNILEFKKYSVVKVYAGQSLWEAFSWRPFSRESQECKIQTLDKKIQVSLNLKNLKSQDSEHIEFEISEFGGDGEQAEFLPIIEVKSKSGLLYKVDIRGLFFSDQTLQTRSSFLGQSEYDLSQRNEPHLHIHSPNSIDASIFCQRNR